MTMMTKRHRCVTTFSLSL